MAQPAVAPEVHEPLDVHGRVASQVAFNDEITVDRFSDLQDLCIGQLVHAPLLGDADLGADVVRQLRPDAVDVLKGDNDALLRWNVDACYTSHIYLPETAFNARHEQPPQPPDA